MAVNIFSLVGSIMVDSDEANKSIQKTGTNAKSLATTLGSGLKTVGKAAAGIATVTAGAAAAAGAAIYSLSNDAAAVGDNVDKMSQKIGISRQAYQELDFICSQSGTSVDNLKAGLKTLTSVMDTTKAGTSKTKTALEELGVAATDSNGNFRENEEVMWEAFEALSKLENQTEKERLAVELFGKAGSELMPMLNGTTEGIQAMRQQAHDLGLVMTDEAIDGAVKYTDTMDQLQRSFKAAKTSLGTAVLPIIQKFAAKVLDFMPKIQDFIGKLTPPLEKITGTLLDTLGELMDKVLPPLLDLATSLIEPVSKLIESVMPVLVKLLDKATPILLEIVQELLPPLLDILDAFMPILDVLFEILDPILDVVKALIKPLAEVLKAVEPLITSVVKFVDQALTPFKTEIKIVSDILSTVLGPALEAVNKIIEYYIMPTFEYFTAFLQGDFDKGVQIAAEAFTGAFEDAFAIIDSLLGTNFSQWYQEFNQFWQNIGAGLYAALNGDKINENELHGKYSGIAQDVRLAANENMRNGMSADEALAAAKAKYLKSNEALYYWDNYGNYNADEAYAAIKETKAAEKQAWQEKSNYYTQHYGGIPKLAGGGMVYGDTLAVVGDNVGASSNPEVVAPLDELSKIIAKALDSVADKIIAANNSGDIVCQLPDGTELARWTADNINRLSRQEGKCVIKGVG